MQTEKYFKLSGCLTPPINLIQCYNVIMLKKYVLYLMLILWTCMNVSKLSRYLREVFFFNVVYSASYFYCVFGLSEAVVNVAWNPGFLGLFATCLSSGSVIVMELTDTEIKTLASLPADHKASASEKLYFLFCTVQACSCTWCLK